MLSKSSTGLELVSFIITVSVFLFLFLFLITVDKLLGGDALLRLIAF
jgi:hypothetical protein